MSIKRLIGSAPNQVSRNKDLGTLAFQSKESASVGILSVDELRNSTGTANGVAYLNGSKVLTTGSALTFDGTNFVTTGSAKAAGVIITGNNNLDLSGGAASYKITKNGTSSIDYVVPSGKTHNFQIGSSYAVVLESIGVNAAAFMPFGSAVPANGLYLPAANNLGFSVNNAEQMRLTSTGLGIGTSSPAHKLDVVGQSARVANTGSTAITYLDVANAYGNTRIGTDATGSGYLGTASFIPLNIYVGNSVKATFDTSGNLGLGVTPSGWNGYTGFELNNNGAISGTSLTFSRNAYFNGANWVYKATTANGIGQYQISGNGNHYWNVAPSGTAGNAISFTQAMTLDATGSLGIGTTSMASKLHIASAGDVHLTTQNTLANTTGFFGADGTGAYAGSFSNHAFVMYTNSTERMRIDATGNLLPGADITYSLGSPTKRWANVYTGDLHLSNESKGANDVDGTTGNWTIQEGAEDLYIINNKTGKKYKFKLEEV